jgi:acetyl-CoA carboxylase biotin carboxyl carrier protein
MTAKLAIDPELIRALAKLLEETGLGEIEFAEGDRRVRVARPVAAAATTFVSTSAPAAASLPAAAAAADAAPVNAVVSPMVGTVYLAGEPGAPSFVKVGDRVREGQTLLIIEAMKVMNPIRAPRAGTVTRVLVSNGSPVEYGEPLLVIE